MFDGALVKKGANYSKFGQDMSRIKHPNKNLYAFLNLNFLVKYIFSLLELVEKSKVHATMACYN